MLQENTPKIGEIWYTRDTRKTFLVEKVSNKIYYSDHVLDIRAYVFGEGKEDCFFYGKNNIHQWVKISGSSS